MKKFIVIIIILLVSLGIWYTLTNTDIFKSSPQTKKSPNEQSLIKLGFTEEETSNIVSTFNEDAQTKIISLDNKELVDEMINNEEFNKEKLDDYLNFRSVLDFAW